MKYHVFRYKSEANNLPHSPFSFVFNNCLLSSSFVTADSKDSVNLFTWRNNMKGYFRLCTGLWTIVCMLQYGFTWHNNDRCDYLTGEVNSRIEWYLCHFNNAIEWYLCHFNNAIEWHLCHLTPSFILKSNFCMIETPLSLCQHVKTDETTKVNHGSPRLRLRKFTPSTTTLQSREVANVQHKRSIGWLRHTLVSKIAFSY